MPPDLRNAIWTRPRVKRWINNGYVYFLHMLHLLLDLSPWFLRNLAWRLLLKQCGSGVFFDHRVYIKFPWLVSLGSDVSVNRGVEFYCGMLDGSRVLIGSNVRIAPNVKFHAAGHDPDDPLLMDNGGDIIVGDDVWIGAGALILQGVHIGRGAVIAAGSVVSRDVPEHCIAGGVPARVIRTKRSHDVAD